jgi:hypothetical protein
MSGPIIITPEGARLFDQAVHRDEDDDNDCMYFDPIVNKCFPCMGDSHYMCEECASFRASEWNEHGVAVFTEQDSHE